MGVGAEGVAQAGPKAGPALNTQEQSCGGLCNVSQLGFVLLSNHFFWLHLFLVNL